MKKKLHSSEFIFWHNKHYKQCTVRTTQYLSVTHLHDSSHSLTPVNVDPQLTREEMERHDENTWSMAYKHLLILHKILTTDLIFGIIALELLNMNPND